ncbi:hypothetical protein PMIN06_003111 [Paraphaeosphaeria minitans]
MKFKQKLLSSGKSSGVNIYLVEPVLFLRGFRQNQMSEQSTVVLRGSLNLHITKPTKIKAITLTFHGKAVTKWPEGDDSTLTMHARVLKEYQAFLPRRSDIKRRSLSSITHGRSLTINS